MTEKTMQPFIDSPSSLFVTDGSGNILISNEFTALTLGMSLEELLQLNVQDLVKAGYYKHSITMEAIQTKQKVCKTIKTNRGFNIRSTATPLLYKSGEVQLVVTTSNNIKIENQQTFIEVDSVNKMEEQEKKREQQKLVVESLAMKQIMKVCRKISHYNSKILIYGESGTGKEVIAKYIHQHSDRADGPFITINCAAIPHSLFEYELFGYEKGVLAGVFDEKKGMIEEANNGYLFLDEISEIPLEMQAKLLRVLEENELRRIGGTKQIPINCRVITATNCDLWGLVQQNKFREDLYYRINVIPIYIPPLRHRKPDLVGLLSYFLQNINDNYGTNYRFKSRGI
jgi:transcriptional regulator with PAS, ATPase and Fis domain